jgi:hypothetical protein
MEGILLTTKALVNSGFPSGVSRGSVVLRVHFQCLPFSCVAAPRNVLVDGRAGEAGPDQLLVGSASMEFISFPVAVQSASLGKVDSVGAAAACRRARASNAPTSCVPVA